MAKEAAKLKASVTFKSFGNSGSKTARLGVHIDADEMDVEEAHMIFLDSRCTVNLIFDPNDGAKPDTKQAKLDNISELKFRGVADIKGYRASADGYAIGLTFALSELDGDDIKVLNSIAGKAGQIQVERTGSATQEKPVKAAA